MKLVADPPPSIDRLVSSGVERVLIIGDGVLGDAFRRICERRGLPYRVLSAEVTDAARRDSLEEVLREHNPWAVVNTAEYGQIDRAETDENRCYEQNARSVEILARACSRQGLRLLTFSSDLVFGGEGDAPLTESEPVGPHTVYGSSKARAEHVLRGTFPAALVVRCGPLFGPWDTENDLYRALSRLARNGHIRLARDEIVSPTYIPDLVHASLDLLIDDETGLWHLANVGAVSPAAFVRQAAVVAGIVRGTVRGVRSSSLGRRTPRAGYRALRSERGGLMPTLEDAIARYLRESPVSWIAPEQLQLGVPDEEKVAV
jgi:dTDP-4-dehydrorhamnose reductase